MDEVGVMNSEEALHNRLCIVHGDSGTYRTVVNGVHLWALPHCERHELTGELVFGVATGRGYQEHRFIAENALEEAMHRLRLEEHGPEDPPYGQIAVLLIESAAKDIEKLKRDVDKEEEEEVRANHRDEIVE